MLVDNRKQEIQRDQILESEFAKRDRILESESAATVANRRLAANESTHHRKDSKVVAILKKTGSILTKPFKLIAGR
jgi:hypothetical protein